MSTVVESLQSERSIVRTKSQRDSSTHFAPARWGRSPERWKSAMNAQDLQCLLQVIEAELIPRLVADYSPARQAPLRSGGPAG